MTGEEEHVGTADAIRAAALSHLSCQRCFVKEDGPARLTAFVATDGDHVCVRQEIVDALTDVVPAGCTVRVVVDDGTGERWAGRVPKTLRTTDEGNALVDELLSDHTKGLEARKPMAAHRASIGADRPSIEQSQAAIEACRVALAEYEAKP